MFLLLGKKCKMKGSVLELVRKFGAPPEEEEYLNSYEQKIINAILDGCNTKEEIALNNGVKPASIQNRLGKMYKIAENCGYVYSHKVNRLPEFVKWVRGEYERI